MCLTQLLNHLVHSCIPRLAKPLEHLLQDQYLWHLALVLGGVQGQSDSNWVSSSVLPSPVAGSKAGGKLVLQFLFIHRGLQERQSLCHFMCTGYHTGQVTENSGSTWLTVLAVQKYREISNWPEIELGEVKKSRCYDNWYSFPSFQQSWMFNWFSNLKWQGGWWWCRGELCKRMRKTMYCIYLY